MGRVDDAMRRARGVVAGQVAVNSAVAVFEPEADTVVLDVTTPAEERDPKVAVGPAGPLDSDGKLHVGPRQKVVVDDDMMPGSREQYRRLAAALHHSQAATGMKVVMVSSALASEGKTLTASNLALTLSESYRQKVLLIDADFRRPSLHTFFRIDGSPGLNDVLASEADAHVPLQRVTALLTVLPAGRPTSDPMAGLVSPRMRELIAEAREDFTWVIVDTPPVGLLTDANLLGAMVDGVLLVIKAEVTPYPAVKRAVEALGADRILGVVLNQATTSGPGYGYYDDYYYGSPQPKD